MDESTLRLFLGIPIPETHLAPLEQVRNQNKDLGGIRWVPSANFHITTYFLGDVAAEALPNLIELIRLGLQKAQPFELTFDRFYFAPKPREPRMIWARYKKEDAFKEIVSEMDRLYSQVSERQHIRKSPIPHVTLARLRDFTAFDEVDFAVNFSKKIIEVKEMVLWESVPGENGVMYREVERFGF